jgi:hypothetical protein
MSLTQEIGQRICNLNLTVMFIHRSSFHKLTNTCCRILIVTTFCYACNTGRNEIPAADCQPDEDFRAVQSFISRQDKN